MKEHLPHANRSTVLQKILPKGVLPKSLSSKGAPSKGAPSKGTASKGNPSKNIASTKLLSCTVALWSCCALAVPQEFADLEVREIATGTAGEGIFLATSNREASADGCGPSFFIEAGHPLLNQNLAIALSGLYAKSRMQIRVDGCAANGSMKIKGIGVAR